MFPVGDDNKDRTTYPIINYLLIALNIFVFVFLQGCGDNQKFTYAFSTVPAEIVTGKDYVSDDRTFEDPVTGNQFTIPGLQETPVPVYLTLFTSMFMHGGIAHIFGNMLFLLIFGDNIEDRIGHLRYLFFYLICGVLASITQVLATKMLGGNMLLPSLGASGAISGVLGGYLLLFPTRRVRVLIFYFLTEVPAIIAIGLWFVFQLVNGMGALGSGSQEGGVAYGAHIGGFVAGLILITFFTIGKSARKRVSVF